MRAFSLSRFSEKPVKRKPPSQKRKQEYFVKKSAFLYFQLFVVICYISKFCRTCHSKLCFASNPFPPLRGAANKVLTAEWAKSGVQTGNSCIFCEGSCISDTQLSRICKRSPYQARYFAHSSVYFFLRFMRCVVSGLEYR